MRQQDELGFDGGRDTELAQAREQVGILAEQVGRLLDVIARQHARGQDTALAEEKLEVLEVLMWKLHQRQVRLKAEQRVLN